MFSHRKEIKPVNPKWNQLWIFTGRIEAEAEGPILWLANVNSQLFGKDPDAGKDWMQKEKREAEDEIGSIANSVDMNLSKLREMVKDRGAWCVAVHGATENQTWLSESTTTALPGAGCQGDTCVCLFFVWSQRTWFIRKPPFGRGSRETLLLLLSHFSRVRLCATP